jgi:hypothetical protein
MNRLLENEQTIGKVFAVVAIKRVTIQGSQKHAAGLWLRKSVSSQISTPL